MSVDPASLAVLQNVQCWPVPKKSKRHISQTKNSALSNLQPTQSLTAYKNHQNDSTKTQGEINLENVSNLQSLVSKAVSTALDKDLTLIDIDSISALSQQRSFETIF